MREGSKGRSAVFPWGDTQAVVAYAVGDIVYSGGTAGSVVSVDAEARTFAIVWDDGDGGPICYPLDAPYLRKKMPWET